MADEPNITPLDYETPPPAPLDDDPDDPICSKPRNQRYGTGGYDHDLSEHPTILRICAIVLLILVMGILLAISIFAMRIR